MSTNKTLLLRALINIEMQSSDKLLDNKSFQRLCIIGKSVNGRGTPAGLYKNAADVAADYGVEAGEYRLAVNHFAQFENGEVLIATADYNSISRPPIPILPPDPEPDPEPDEDFANEYISVGYEPLDIEYFEPDEPPVEVEPVPVKPPEVDTGCRSTSADFNVARVDSLYKHDDISLWVIIEMQGVNYPSRISSIDAYKLISMIEDKGAGFNSNQIISALISDIAIKYPSRIDYMNSHTNFALSSFDFGKRLSGIDFANKDDLKEAIEQIGGKAENFVNKNQTIKFRNLSENELLSKSGVDVEAINLLDVFNKGNNFDLKSCMSFDYTPPVPDYDSLCRATYADFNTSRVRELRSVTNISIWAVIEIDGIDHVVKFSNMPAKSFIDLTEVNGSAMTANQLMSTLVGDLLLQHPEHTDYITRHTNYLLSSFDFGKRLSGIDAINRDDVQESIEYIGGQARNFRNDPVRIKFKNLSLPDLNFKSEGDIKAFNYLDIFNKGRDFELKSCMAFDFIDMALPPEPEPEPEPTDQALLFSTTNNNVTSSAVTMPLKMTIDFVSAFDTGVIVKENGFVILDSKKGVLDATRINATFEEGRVIILLGDMAGADLSSATSYNEYYVDVDSLLIKFENASERVGTELKLDWLTVVNFSDNVDGYQFYMKDKANKDRIDLKLPDYLPPSVISLANMISSNGFNQDVSPWYVRNVENMDYFITDAPAFVQDLSIWCVPLIPVEPVGWDSIALPAMPKPYKPEWGTCKADDGPIDPEPEPEPEPEPASASFKFDTVFADANTYQKVMPINLNIFTSGDTVTNSISLKQNGVVIFSTLSGSPVATSPCRVISTHSLKKGYELLIEDSQGETPGEVSNSYELDINFSEENRVLLTAYRPSMTSTNSGMSKVNVTNFGNGFTNYQFYMHSPRTVKRAELTLPNYLPPQVTSLKNLVNDDKVFNQNISAWNTSNVTDMTNMMPGCTAFNQDLSVWCVTNIEYEPEGWRAKMPAMAVSNYPVWGTCPPR